MAESIDTFISAEKPSGKLINIKTEPGTHKALAARFSLASFWEMRMLRTDKLNSSERIRTLPQTVAHAYTWLWDFFWLPIRLIANRPSLTNLLPAKWRPFLLAARLGRWPQKINDDHYTLCSNSKCETCRSLGQGEIEIEEERQITHDPFGILASLKR